MRRTGLVALAALGWSGAAAQSLVNGHGVPPQIVPLYQERGAPSFTVAPSGSGAGLGGLGGGTHGTEQHARRQRPIWRCDGGAVGNWLRRRGAGCGPAGRHQR